jgi:DNA polymerase-3 subunit delta'
MLFKEVIGNEVLKQKLTAIVKENRVSHALLFHGPEGSGQLPLAIAYAQYLNCTDKKDDDSCGVCPSCIKFNKLIHPDLHFVYPVIKAKNIKEPVSDDFISEWREQVIGNPYFNLQTWLRALDNENSQGSIYAKESNEIIKKLNLKTFEAQYKIMIIWMADRMNLSSANKLLKLIEEPPDNTVFILITEKTEKIIPTILSRTQLVKVKRIQDEELFNYFRADSELSDLDLKDLVRLANGNLLKASELLNQSEVNNQFRTLYINMMRLAYSLKMIDEKRNHDKLAGLSVFGWVNEASGLGREPQKNFLEYAIRLTRENFILNTQNPEITYLTTEEAKFSGSFNQFIHAGNISKISDELNKAHYHIERNGNPKLIFLDLIIKLHRYIRQN